MNGFVPRLFEDRVARLREDYRSKVQAGLCGSRKYFLAWAEAANKQDQEEMLKLMEWAHALCALEREWKRIFGSELRPKP